MKKISGSLPSKGNEQIWHYEFCVVKRNGILELSVRGTGVGFAAPVAECYEDWDDDLSMCLLGLTLALPLIAKMAPLNTSIDVRALQAINRAVFGEEHPGTLCPGFEVRENEA